MISAYLYITFFAYILITVYIGYFSYKNTKNISDFYIAGRRLNSTTAALSSGASDMSGWLLLGLPGYAFISGLEAGWIALGVLLGCWANWLLVAKKLRLQSAAFKAITLADFLQVKADSNGKLIKVLAALIILIFFTLYTSAGLVAAGKLFTFAFGIDYQLAVIIGAIAVMSYTLFGGFLAVSITDVLQSLLMLLALLLVVVFAYLAIDNTQIQQVSPHLFNPFTNNLGEPLSFIAIVSLLAWGLGYCGQPHILARFKAIASVDLIPKARNMAVGWSCICLISAILVGLLGKIYLAENADTIDAERIFMHLINIFFHPLIAGVLLAAVLAAIMSTADSQLLVASSALTNDLIGDKYAANSIALGRATVLVISVIATVNSLYPGASTLNIISYAWAGFGAAFGPVLLYCLYSKKVIANACIAGILVGAITVIVWKNIDGGIFQLYEIIPGFAFSILAIAGFHKFNLKS